MNFLEKLEMLMKQKQVNKRQLSIGSDIPYSTIDNLWKKGYDNIKLSTLKKLASFFGVTLDFLARDVIDLSDAQSENDSEIGETVEDRRAYCASLLFKDSDTEKERKMKESLADSLSKMNIEDLELLYNIAMRMYAEENGNEDQD